MGVIYVHKRVCIHSHTMIAFNSVMAIIKAWFVFCRRFDKNCDLKSNYNSQKNYVIWSTCAEEVFGGHLVPLNCCLPSPPPFYYHGNLIRVLWINLGFSPWPPSLKCQIKNTNLFFFIIPWQARTKIRPVPVIIV